MKTKVLVGIALFATTFAAWAAAGCRWAAADQQTSERMPRQKRGILLLAAPESAAMAATSLSRPGSIAPCHAAKC